MQKQRRYAPLGILLVACLGLAACGGSGSHHKSSSPTALPSTTVHDTPLPAPIPSPTVRPLITVYPTVGTPVGVTKHGKPGSGLTYTCAAGEKTLTVLAGRSVEYEGTFIVTKASATRSAGQTNVTVDITHKGLDLVSLIVRAAGSAPHDESVVNLNYFGIIRGGRLRLNTVDFGGAIGELLFCTR